MRTLLLSSLLFSAIGAMAQPTSVTVGNTTLDVRVVIQGTNSTNGIDIPWEIQWGPDDYIWMTERSGRVSRLNPETGVRTTILDLSNTVYDQSEAGLLGLQLHPDFENNPYVYLAYTYSSGSVKERIVRYTYNAQTGQLGSPLILLDNINGNSTHSGCRLLILNDNTLLATTGDYQNQPSAQSTSSLNGKILRMNLDGTIPSDNPFGPSSYIYSMGHRNPQGLLQAPNGIIYSSEHGPTTNDEFNIIVAGANYGWPTVEGFCNLSAEQTFCNANSNYEDPIAIWYEGSTIAPSDLIWYDHPAIPEWQGKMLMTVLKAEHVKVIEVDGTTGTTVVSQEILFNSAHVSNPGSSFNAGQFNRLRDICAAPDGRVFLATSGSSWANTSPFTHSIVELKNSAYVPTGINGVAQVRVGVYPNPSNDGVLRITFPNELLGGGYEVIDMAGRTVLAGNINAIGMNVELPANIPSGVLIFRATSNAATATEQILLTR